MRTSSCTGQIAVRQSAFAQDSRDRDDMTECIVGRREHSIKRHARAVPSHALYVEYVVRNCSLMFVAITCR